MFFYIVLTPISKIVSEYDQEIPQSQTADNPVAPRGRAAQPSQDTSLTLPVYEVPAIRVNTTKSTYTFTSVLLLYLFR